MEYLEKHPKLAEQFKKLCQTRRNEILSTMLETDATYKTLCQTRVTASMALKNALVDDNTVFEEYSDSVYAQEVYELDAVYRQAFCDAADIPFNLSRAYEIAHEIAERDKKTLAAERLVENDTGIQVFAPAETKETAAVDKKPTTKQIQAAYNEIQDDYLRTVSSALIATAMDVFYNSLTLEQHEGFYSSLAADTLRDTNFAVPQYGEYLGDLIQWNSIIALRPNYGTERSAVTHERAILKLASPLDGQRSIAILGAIVAAILDITIIILCFLRGRRHFPNRSKEISTVVSVIFLKRPERFDGLARSMLLSLLWLCSGLLYVLSYVRAQGIFTVGNWWEYLIAGTVSLFFALIVGLYANRREKHIESILDNSVTPNGGEPHGGVEHEQE